MHIHILGICGTFMGSLAQLAKKSGMRVTGCDANVYPPMSTQLELAGIELVEGFGLDQFELNPDIWVIGNALSRGNLLVEAILNRGEKYVSGPEFLAEQVLPGRHVLAVSGTHGKTSTASMLAWILEYAGLNPGFLIGGVPDDFGESARLGQGEYFVVEADEYDTAFFDKRSKFVHYRPRTLVINNLEFDHADIFENLQAIQRQFHHLIRTIPQQGNIYFPSASAAINEVLEMGCWSNKKALSFGESVTQAESGWRAVATSADFSQFDVFEAGQSETPGASVQWNLIGEHNMQNALGAIAAASDAGVDAAISTAALAEFKGVKRRLEIVAKSENITLYDDFAHHPTAIKTTLEGLRAKVGIDKIIAVIEPRSNTMKLGIHKDELAKSVANADQAIWFQPDNIDWSLSEILSSKDLVFSEIDQILSQVSEQTGGVEKAHVLVMSNGGFAGIHQKLIMSLKLTP
jgi:UDP-N-acetylmuramate: L-alanyl-gamma-D-glutamyl-meso-diaminopimelate ligase